MNTLANAAQKHLGDVPTSTTNSPNYRPNEKMKALVWHGAAKVSVDEMPVPTITDPTDVVLVRFCQHLVGTWPDDCHSQRVTGSTVRAIYSSL